jgi:hypothetical protein
LAYSIPIISVSIAADTPHLHRARYRAPRGLGLETLVALCLSGRRRRIVLWLNRRRR